MKPYLLITYCLACMLCLLMITGCEKEAGLNPDVTQLNTEVTQLPIEARTICGLVNYTAPTTVNVGDMFNISALINCGRVALDRAYILVGTDTVRVGLTCTTPGLLWEALENFQCYTVDLSVNTSLDSAGIFLFRTRHNFNDGNCDGLGGGNQTGNCPFTGVNFCCFAIEAIEPCEIEAGDYITFSQGYFLQSQNGAEFLEAHPELGPIVVGCNTNTTSYTLEEIIAMDPGNSTPPGILVKQIITVTLDVLAQSIWIPDADLGCLIVVSDGLEETTLDDLFEGMTVNEILEEANNYVGECGSDFTAGELTAILAAIVDNFHPDEDGNAVNQGLLTCCE